jgi:tetratricopeptide (TPR) repeat protein
VAAVLSNLALVQTERHAYQDAEDLYSRALVIVERNGGPGHPDIAAIANNLGQVNSFEGRYEDAEKLYLRAIGIWERTLGPTHPDVAGCQLNYAATLRKVHRKKEAAQLEARARQSLAAHNRENATGSLVDWRELQRPAK